MRRRFVMGLVGILATLAFVLPRGFATRFPPQASQIPSQSPLEITQTDLFAMKGWNSNRVSVQGFMLGMERRRVLLAAQENGLSLDDERGQGCIKETKCSVFGVGRYNGVDLIFGDGDVLDKISILAWLRGASKEECSAWLASKFRGETRQLVESYSDNLRIRTLGSADAMFLGKMETPPFWRGSLRVKSEWLRLPSRREFEYSRLGLTLVIDGASPGLSGEPGIEKLTIEFKPPRRRQ